MNIKSIMLTGSAITLLVATIQAISAQNAENPPPKPEDTKSVAWYVANIKEARAQNQICYDNPSLKSSENCSNALHALQISFKGGN
ncbi:MAG: EexN family lipoprotein [Methylomonas sp.]|jgi:hypothetical protein